MRKLSLLVLGLALITFVGVAQASDYLSPLSGDEEVPARATKARGNAIYKVSDDGLSIHYRLVVANIDNVVASHFISGPKESTPRSWSSSMATFPRVAEV